MADKLQSLVTPRGVAGYAKYLYELDTEGRNASNKYGIKLYIPKDSVNDSRGFIGLEGVTFDEFAAHIAELHKRGGGKEEGPLKDGDKMRTKAGDKVERAVGNWVISAKSKHEVTLTDSKGNDLPKNVVVYGGDIIRLALQPAFYDGFGGGVTLYLNAVRLIEKRAGGPASTAGLDDDDGGYVAGQDTYGDDEEAPAEGASSSSGDY